MSIRWDELTAPPKEQKRARRERRDDDDGGTNDDPNDPTYTDDQKAAAVAAVTLMPAAKDSDPNKITPVFPKAASIPTVRDLDFVDVKEASVALSSLFSSDKYMKRDGLIWHIQNVPQAKNPNPFTSHPVVGACQDGNIVIDGHHRLAALALLGATSTTVWSVPMDCKVT